MDLLETFNEAWKWTGVRAEEIIAENKFGNLLFKCEDGRFWRMCPEELYCENIAKDFSEFMSLRSKQEFLEDWKMEEIIELAEETLGPLPEGQRYCLKLPGVMGGQYVPENFGLINQVEQIKYAAALTEQINNLPDGTKIQFQV